MPNVKVELGSINNTYQKFCRYLFLDGLKKTFGKDRKTTQLSFKTEAQKNSFVIGNIPIQIYYGGSSSGKSFFILGQRTVLDLLAGGRNFLICRQVEKMSRHSTFNEVCKGIGRLSGDLAAQFKINKTDLTITAPNGYQAIFKGLDNVENIKSVTPKKGVITDIIIEEATQTTEDSVEQLLKRLRGKVPGLVGNKRLVFLFNPVYKTHWIYKKYFVGRFDDSKNLYISNKIIICKTTYLDNLNNLTHDDVERITDKNKIYYYNVYCLGNWGILGDLIYTNWEVADLRGIDRQIHLFYNGQDFGFRPDPNAFVRVGYKPKDGKKEEGTIYITKEKTAIMQHMEGLAVEIKPIVGNEPVFCDCASPDRINKLQIYNINAVPVKKGKDSLDHGIQWIQNRKIYVDKSCVNTINELSMYEYDRDKDGNIINKPRDKDNHHLDALRYALENVINLSFATHG